MLRAMQNSENNALQVYLRGRLFLLFYRATARQRGNSFPSCAWRMPLLHRDFSLAFALNFLDWTTFYDNDLWFIPQQAQFD